MAKVVAGDRPRARDEQRRAQAAEVRVFGVASHGGFRPANKVHESCPALWRPRFNLLAGSPRRHIWGMVIEIRLPSAGRSSRRAPSSIGGRFSSLGGTRDLAIPGQGAHMLRAP